MTTYVALLRAVNVGAANRIKMDALRAAFVAAGYEDAKTHIQSGNVIFSSSKSESATKDRVEQLIADEMGKPITAILRTPKELAAVTKANPFEGRDIAALYVGFLDTKPAAAAAASFAELSFEEERVALHGREVYIDYGNAHAGTSKLTNALIEKKLGCRATARNWKVTNALAELAASHGEPSR